MVGSWYLSFRAKWKIPLYFRAWLGLAPFGICRQLVDIRRTSEGSVEVNEKKNHGMRMQTQQGNTQE